MTREKFIDSITSSRFRECTREEGYTLYERDGNYIFVFPQYIASSLHNPEWQVSYEDIVLTRSRQGWFEIELNDAPSITLVSEEDIEIGCMG